jgi:hypothetical protein
VAFAAQFADGATYGMTAQAVAGSVLSAWSAPEPITVAVLPPPPLRLSFASPEVVAAWDAVGSLTRYEFELWSTGRARGAWTTPRSRSRPTRCG